MLNARFGVVVGLVTLTLKSGVVVPDTLTFDTPPPPPVPGPIAAQVLCPEQYMYLPAVRSQIVAICWPVAGGSQFGSGSVEVLMSVGRVGGAGVAIAKANRVSAARLPLCNHVIAAPIRQQAHEVILVPQEIIGRSINENRGVHALEQNAADIEELHGEELIRDGTWIWKRTGHSQSTGRHAIDSFGSSRSYDKKVGGHA